MNLLLTLNQLDYLALDDQQKSTFILTLVQKWGISSILDQIIEVLQSDVEADIQIAYLFLRDITLKRKQESEFNELVDQFRSAAESSQLFQVMNQNLYSKDRLTRESTYVAFGKMSFPQNKIYLQEAIEYYKDHFPDQVNGLTFEFNWLANLA